MRQAALNFQSIPDDLRQAVELAEARHGIAVTPLQRLSGGRSGALIYLARVASRENDDLRHLILKLDRKHPKSSSDEIERHRTVQQASPTAFAEQHLAQLAFERVEHGQALAIFYTIAGHSLRRVRTLSSFRRQRQVERLFARATSLLLVDWNPDPGFETLPHPQHLLERWLGFRLDQGQSIEAFVTQVSGQSPNTAGFLVDGHLLPNPLHYARQVDAWGSPRPLDVAVGLQHGDMNTNNLLAAFAPGSDELEGCFLIDFAMFKPKMGLLYDQRYLEMSYLIDYLETAPADGMISLLSRSGDAAQLASEDVPVEMSGMYGAILAGRNEFDRWVRAKYPSLQDDLWGQYWLAGTAAGLAYCHKAALSDELRLTALIYAAANLAQFLRLFELPLPTEARQLRSASPLALSSGSKAGPVTDSRGNLPAPMTNFIGRATELNELQELLRQPQTRLVTLTGPGGTGKTRLAIEAARAVADDFQGGAHFIDLSGLDNPEHVLPTAAHTLGVREGGGLPPLEKLKDYLTNRKMLLFFDNFEQVTGAAMELHELLMAAPDVTALVTSRLPLQVRGELEFPVSPLDLPDVARQGGNETEGERAESVALFEQAARSIQPGFEITAQNRDAVEEICRRLDGLPLAIELAAARTKLLTPRALLARLEEGLNILVGAAKDRPERQRTLYGTIDWSYQLLGEGARDLLLRLGVFSGGFTLQATNAVCQDLEPDDVFEGIEILLNNSLIRQVSSATEEPRFAMLQTIRDYSLEKATEVGILADLQQAHFEYFSGLAEGGLEGGIFGPDSVYWLQVYEEEHDNFRQALSWALERPDEFLQPMLAMVMQLSWFWYRFGYLKEGSQWMERALEATESAGVSRARVMALAGRGSLALWSGDLVLAAKTTREAIEMAEQMGLDLIAGLTKMTYGTTLINQGRDQEAYHQLISSVELYDQHDQVWLKGTALVHLANVSLGMGDAEQALQWLDSAMPLLKASGDSWNIAFGLSNYGEVARTQGEYEAAEDYYRRTQALYEQADSKGDQARLDTALGYIAQHKGNSEEARALFVESLAEFRMLGNQRGIAEALAGLAGLAAEQGHADWAAPLLGAAEGLLESVDGVWWPADRAEIERTKERLQAELGDRIPSLTRQGEHMSMEEAIAYAEAGW